MTDPELDEIMQTLAEDLINYDQRMTKAGAPDIRFVHKYTRKAEKRLLAWRDEADGCPCLLTEPCSDQCTCVDSFSSRGCMRCCKYGSLEQRKAAADRLAQLIKQNKGENRENVTHNIKGD